MNCSKCGKWIIVLLRIDVVMKKFISFLKKKIFLLGYKRLDVKSCIEDSIEKEESEISYFALSSNVIKIFDHEGKKFFFRECRKHEKFNNYVDNVIEEFFCAAAGNTRIFNMNQKIPIQINFSNEKISDFREYVDKCRSKISFYKKIKKIDEHLKECDFNIWTNHTDVPLDSLKKMGLNDCPQNIKDVLTYFFCFMQNSVKNYLFHNFETVGDYETFFASKSIATYKIAKILGIERLIASTKFICLVVAGKKHYGVMCASANGKRALDCDYAVNRSLHRELINLHVLDALCLQADHWVNNYNIIADEFDNAISVCAFDNDCKWTFFPWLKLSFNSMCNGAPIINSEKMLNIPHMDKDFANSVFNVDIKRVKKELRPYLNVLQMCALIMRVKQLQKMIKKMSEKNNRFIVDRNEWSGSALNSDLAGKYGNSYLYQYVKKDETEMRKKNGFRYPLVKLVW